MFTLEKPFHELKTDGQVIMAKVFGRKYPSRPIDFRASIELPDQLWNILENCWDFDPARRPTMTTVLCCLRGFTPIGIDLAQTLPRDYPDVLHLLKLSVSYATALFSEPPSHSFLRHF